MFSVALLVHIRHRSGSFAVADAPPLRRLWATPGFMPTSPCSEIHTHCREQILYFDHKGLVRRHDYTSEVYGTWAKAAHYAFDHQSLEGGRADAAEGDSSPQRKPPAHCRHPHPAGY